MLPKTLTSRQRVKRMIAGDSVDRLPKGELFFPIGFLERLTRERYHNFSSVKRALFILDADFVVLPFARYNEASMAAPVSVEEAKLWTSLTDYFVFAGIPGVFWSTILEIGSLEKAAYIALKQPKWYLELAKSLAALNITLANLCLEAGAHGIIILDDLAGEGRPLFSPPVLQELVFPFLNQMVSEIKKQGAPVFLHTDGDISLVIKDIVNLSIDGLHGFSAPHIEIVRNAFSELTLAGNIAASKLEQLNDGQVIELVNNLVALSKKGPLLLGTDGGLTNESNIKKLRLIYETA